jgi:hypothetical protein
VADDVRGMLGSKPKQIAYYTKKTLELPKKIELSIYQAIINTTKKSKKLLICNIIPLKNTE